MSQQHLAAGASLQENSSKNTGVNCHLEVIGTFGCIAVVQALKQTGFDRWDCLRALTLRMDVEILTLEAVRRLISVLYIVFKIWKVSVKLMAAVCTW